MIKLFAAAAGIAGIVASVPAQSQGVQLQMSDNNLSQFCFWNSKIFSIGSFFCVEKNKMLQCNASSKDAERASWEMLDHGACTKADVPK
jgi:uncharacterized membrane protein